ncbi:MAG: hypothetical protein J5607_02975, partial [Clostridiales bacterium]|nr:hypothetical protein [Clostridiales bacterium]
MKGRNLLAVCLTASMFISAAACGKKKNEETQPTVSDVSGSETTTTTREISSGDEKASPNNNVDYSADVVSETDPYFESISTELMVPTDPSKTVEYFTVLHNPAFAGKYISMDYILKYVMPADVQSQLEQLVLPDEAAKYNEIYNGYMDVGTASFNSKGEYLFSLRTRETI